MRVSFRAGAPDSSHGTRRSGPGYLDWPVTDQPALVGALAAGEALPGIEVLDSGAVLPEKTITGLYGLVPSSKE